MDGQGQLDGANYRELQGVARQLGLPGNLKRKVLIEVIHARRQGDHVEVKRLLQNNHDDLMRRKAEKALHKGHQTKRPIGRPRKVRPELPVCPQPQPQPQRPAQVMGGITVPSSWPTNGGPSFHSNSPDLRSLLSMPTPALQQYVRNSARIQQSSCPTQHHPQPQHQFQHQPFFPSDPRALRWVPEQMVVVAGGEEPYCSQSCLYQEPVRWEKPAPLNMLTEPSLVRTIENSYLSDRNEISYFANSLHPPPAPLQQPQCTETTFNFHKKCIQICRTEPWTEPVSGYMEEVSTAGGAQDYWAPGLQSSPAGPQSCLPEPQACIQDTPSSGDSPDSETQSAPEAEIEVILENNNQSEQQQLVLADTKPPPAHLPVIASNLFSSSAFEHSLEQICNRQPWDVQTITSSPLRSVDLGYVEPTSTQRQVSVISYRNHQQWSVGFTNEHRAIQ